MTPSVVMDDIERIQVYILGRLDREPQKKADVIDAIEGNRGEDRDIIESAFEDLTNRGEFNPTTRIHWSTLLLTPSRSRCFSKGQQ